MELQVPDSSLRCRRPSHVPMSGTNEALWFAPGGSYALDDDTWDPFSQDLSDDDDVTIGESLEESDDDTEHDNDPHVTRSLATSEDPAVEAAESEEIARQKATIQELENKWRALEEQAEALEAREDLGEERLLGLTELQEYIHKTCAEIQAATEQLHEFIRWKRQQDEQRDEQRQALKGRYQAQTSGDGTAKRGHVPGVPQSSQASVARRQEPEQVAVTDGLVASLGSLMCQLRAKKQGLSVVEEELVHLQGTVEQINNSAAPQTPPNNNSANLQSPPNNNLQGACKVNLVNEQNLTMADLPGLCQRQATERVKQQHLEEEITEMEKKLSAKKKKVGAHPQVRRAIKGYRENWVKFVKKIFTRIQEGNLDDVVLMTAALDIEGASTNVRLENIIQMQSNLSVLHLALYTEQQHIVNFLVQHSGQDLTTVSIQTGDCDNLTPLYIAIQHGKLHNVKLLLDTVPTENNQRAKYINQRVPNKAYEGAPYDELPLAASVWSSAGGKVSDIKQMLDFLVQNGADLELPTSTGDTLLHLLVLQVLEGMDNLNYFRKFLKDAYAKAAGIWWKNNKVESDIKRRRLSVSDAEVLGLKYLLSIPNDDGLTPITLAAKEECPLYNDFVNWENVLRFPDLKMGQQFSQVDTYNITDMTSLMHLPSDRFSYNSQSVMHVLAHNSVNYLSKAWKVDISCTEPLNSLINIKWSTYQWLFYFWGVVHVIFMTAFTSATFRYHPGRSNGTDTVDPLQVNASNGSQPTAAKLLPSGYYGPVAMGNPVFGVFLVLPIIYIIFELIDCSCMCMRSVSCHYSLTGNAIYRGLSMVFSVFTILWFVFHMNQNVNQDILLSLALLFGWLFGIFFTRTINFPGKPSQIGAFSVMVQRMLFHDLTPFLLVSVFVLVAFTAAIHATMLHSEEAVLNRYRFRETFFNMLKYYSGLENAKEHTESRETEYAKALLSVYGIISVVLLINMLIAAMNKTYDMVREAHTDLVVRQRLSVILMLERRLPLNCLRNRTEGQFDREFNRNTKKEEFFLKVVSKKVISKKRKQGKKNNK